MGAQAAWGRVIGEGSAMAHWRALVTCAYQRGGRTAGRRIASKVPRVGRDVLCVPCHSRQRSVVFSVSHCTRQRRDGDPGRWRELSGPDREPQRLAAAGRACGRPEHNRLGPGTEGHGGRWAPAEPHLERQR